MANSPCEKCGQRPHSWFTSEGYLCSPCAETLAAQAKAGAHVILIERLRKTLMERHADDWDMETISEAAHLCADEVIDLVEPHKVLWGEGREKVTGPNE